VSRVLRPARHTIGHFGDEVLVFKIRTATWLTSDHAKPT